MKCCQCQGIEATFSGGRVAKELKNYRKKGPPKTTRFLLQALKQMGVKNTSLLDIGGGIGAIQHDLLKAGSNKATHIDASSAYLKLSKEEATAQGHHNKVTYQHGNFVDLAPNIPAADIVTLDRVICCYHDMPALVKLSSARAKKLYGVIYPKDTWWIKLGITLINFLLWATRDPFRIFAHPTQAVEDIIKANGLTRYFYKKTIFWQVAVYKR